MIPRSQRCFVQSLAIWKALILALVATAGQPALAADGHPELEGLDIFVNTTMAEWKVPGLALAVVHDGKVVHLAGYGFRDLEKQEPGHAVDALPDRLDIEIVHRDGSGYARR